MKQVRLTDKQINTIKAKAKEVFGEQTDVYIFGSRANISKKGGDIDILIITNNLSDKFRKKLMFLSKLFRELGEQKIDVVITDTPKTDIELHALKTGVKI